MFLSDEYKGLYEEISFCSLLVESPQISEKEIEKKVKNNMLGKDYCHTLKIIQ